MRTMESDREWTNARAELLSAVTSLGFPEELGLLMAKQLGGPKAICRMTSYLYQVKPHSAEEVVDEMLAICSDIDAWRRKKQSEEANARYNEIMRRR